MPFPTPKKDPLARQIVAMLICRKRAARLTRLLCVQAGVSDEKLALLDSRYYEAHNAAEAARRMLYASANEPPS